MRHPPGPLPRRRMLLTGGTGFVGGAIARASVRAGYDVGTVARDPAGRAAHDLRADGVAVHGGDLLQGATLTDLLRDVDVLVHAAATYSYSRSDGEAIRHQTPALSRSVMGSALAAGTPHVIDISSAIVFKPHGRGPRRGRSDIESPRWSAEDRAWGDPYLASKVLADAEAERARGRGLPISTIHPALVIGPGDRGPGTSGNLLRSLLQASVVPDVAAGWCDVRDVAEAAVAVAARQPGSRYLIAAKTCSFPDMCRILDGVTGRTRRRITLPRRVVRAVARLNDLAGGWLDASVPPRASLEYLLLTRGPVDGSSGLPALGLRYRDLQATVSDALAWWAHHGMLQAPLTGGLPPAGR